MRMLFQIGYQPIVIYLRIRGTFILDESISSLRFLRVCYGTKRVISSPNYILLKGSTISKRDYFYSIGGKFKQKTFLVGFSVYRDFAECSMNNS